MKELNLKITENNDSLNNAKEKETYIIRKIQTDDIDMENFLFSLGCFEGEEVTVISKFEQNIIITIKGARYSIDSDLAATILIDLVNKVLF